jgi:hypothetical protein
MGNISWGCGGWDLSESDLKRRDSGQSKPTSPAADGIACKSAASLGMHRNYCPCSEIWADARSDDGGADTHDFAGASKVLAPVDIADSVAMCKVD